MFLKEMALRRKGTFMFSGIVEEIGRIRRVKRRGGSERVEVEAQRALEGTHRGDSIAINGTCLTVTDLGARSFMVELAPETLRRTNLGQVRPGDPVNLERSLRVGGRIGGHFVQGHVDGVGMVKGLQPEGSAVIATFSAPPNVLRYVVVKGFVAIDGMSLTVVDLLADRFTISFVPYTLSNTIAAYYRVGTVVNLEADILGKYVERILAYQEGTKEITQESLAQHGFFG